MLGFNAHEQVSFKASEIFIWLECNEMSSGTFGTLPSMNVSDPNASGWVFNATSNTTETRHVQQVAISKITGTETKPVLKMGLTASGEGDTLVGSVAIYAFDNGKKFVEWRRGKHPDALKYSEVTIVLNVMNSIMAEETWYEFDQNGNRIDNDSTKVASTEPMKIFTLGAENTELNQLKIKFIQHMNSLIEAATGLNESMGDDKFIYTPADASMGDSAPMLVFRFYKDDEQATIGLVVDNLGPEKAVNGFSAWYREDYKGLDIERHACISRVGEKEYVSHNPIDGIGFDELSEDDIRSIYDDLIVLENVDGWNVFHGSEFPDTDDD